MKGVCQQTQSPKFQSQYQCQGHGKCHQREARDGASHRVTVEEAYAAGLYPLVVSSCNGAGSSLRHTQPFQFSLLTPLVVSYPAQEPEVEH